MTGKRLTRPTGDRVFLGVCSGIAEYFGVDPTIVRLLFVLAIFAGGSAVLAYIVLAIVMPSADKLPMGEPATPPAVAASTAQPQPSPLGDDVVREIEGSLAKATEEVDRPGS